MHNLCSFIILVLKQAIVQIISFSYSDNQGMSPRNVIQWTSKNVFGNYVGRQEYVFLQDPLIVWHINRWSGGYDGSESTAKAL